MGKKRIAKMEKIPDQKIRMVTYCKRKKGLIKKAIELSLLCDQKVFMFVMDEKQRKVVHFQSDPDYNIVDLFNSSNKREFYSVCDVSICFRIINPIIV